MESFITQEEINKTWKTIASSADPQKMAREKLSDIFVTNEADAQVLDRFMSRFRSMRIGDYGPVLQFEDEYEGGGKVTFSIATGDAEAGIAPSMVKILRKHGSFTLECGGGGFVSFPSNLGPDDWGLDEDWQEECEGAFENPLMVFDVGQNVIVAHPEEKNKHGEPKLYYLDHDDAEPQAMPEDLGSPQIFLRLIGQRLLPKREYFDFISN